jgi:hypothetical protein
LPESAVPVGEKDCTFLEIHRFFQQNRPPTHISPVAFALLIWLAPHEVTLTSAESRMRNRWWPSVVAVSAVVGMVGCADNMGAPGQQLTIYGSTSKPPSLLTERRVSARVVRPSFGYAATDSAGPKSMPIKLYALYLSKHANCSSPILVQNYGPDGEIRDFVANPVLFQAEPDAGTYPCMILRMSDVLTMTPNKTFGPCDSTQTYVGDIYRDGEADWIDQDANPIIGHGTDDPSGAVDDHVAIFFTNDSTAAIARGISRHQLVPLGSPLVAPGQSTLYWDMSGAVQDEGGQCSILPRPLYFE